MSRNLKVSVWRGKQVGGFTIYDVPRNDSQTVLDVVTYIQRQQVLTTYLLPFDGTAGIEKAFACAMRACERGTGSA